MQEDHAAAPGSVPEPAPASGACGDRLEALAPLPPRVPGLEVRGLLGRGTHGSVWAAWDVGAGEQVAVKVAHRGGERRSPGPVPAVSAGDPGDPAPPPSGAWQRRPRGHVGDAAGAAEAAALAREVAVLRRVRHPHLLGFRRVVDLVDGRRAAVLDHAEAGSLRRLLDARGRLEPGEVTTVLVPIAQALAAVHAEGVVHGDVTCSNILLTAPGRPLLADLGSAVLFGPQPPPGGSQGGDADGAACPQDDVRALALVGLRCLLGDEEIGRPTPEVVLRKAAIARDGAGEHAALAEVLLRAASPAGAGHVGGGESQATDADADRAPGGAALRFALHVWDAARACPLSLDRADPDGSLLIARPPGADGFAARAEPASPTVLRRTTGPPEAADLFPRRRGRGEVTVSRRPPRPEPGARPRTGVRVGLGLAVAGAVLAGGSVARDAWSATAARGGDDPPQATSPTRGQVPGPSPGRASSARAASAISAVVPLARARLQSLAAAADASLLDQVDLPGSPALAADTELVGELRRRGLHLEGARAEVRSTRFVGWQGLDALVDVTSGTSAHRRLDASNRVAAEVPATGVRTVRLLLTERAGRWVVREVRPVA